MAQPVLRHNPFRARPAWSHVDLAGSARYACERSLAAARRDPRLFLWDVLWLPFWIGGESPRPEAPGRRPAAAAALTDPAGSYLASRIERVTRRFALAWFAGALLRGVALSLVAMTMWTVLAVLGIAGWPGWTSIAGAIGAGLAAGGVYGWLSRPDRLMVAGMLDRLSLIHISE